MQICSHQGRCEEKRIEFDNSAPNGKILDVMQRSIPFNCVPLWCNTGGRVDPSKIFFSPTIQQ